VKGKSEMTKRKDGYGGSNAGYTARSDKFWCEDDCTDGRRNGSVDL
jgi:hypothetical protein